MDFGILGSSVDKSKLSVTAQFALGIVATQATAYLVSKGYTVGEQDILTSLMEVGIAFGILRKAVVVAVKIFKSKTPSA